MKNFKAWLDENYPSYYASELHELRIDWLEETVNEIMANFGYEVQEPESETELIEWPLSPKVCTCETFGGGAEDWNCPVCGGGRF